MVSAEIGWLIERQIGGRAYWWTGGVGFSYDSLEAIRFARKIDAERVIKAHRLTECLALEHMWCPPLHEDDCRCETCKTHG